MVINTSAALVILQNEPERRRFAEAIEAADARWMSSATWVESSIVIEVRCWQRWSAMVCGVSTD